MWSPTFCRAGGQRVTHFTSMELLIVGIMCLFSLFLGKILAISTIPMMLILLFVSGRSVKSKDRLLFIISKGKSVSCQLPHVFYYVCVSQALSMVCYSKGKSITY